jgi:hypothetical protein
MHNAGGQLRRILLPRTSVNEGPGLQKSSALNVGTAAIVHMSWRTPRLGQHHELAEELPSRGRVESVGDVPGSAWYVPGYGDRRDDARVA